MSVRRNMIWMAASQTSAFIAQFVTTIVLARLLTPYEMGIFAAALAVAAELGLGSGHARHHLAPGYCAALCDA